MNILISADIEGVAGVFHSEQTRPGNPEYERARRWMTAETNAAIQGAFDGGASSVVVNDSHGGFRNLLPDALDRRAEVILGKPRYLGMMAGVENSCDAVFMLGYHGRSQSRGILAHTMNSFAFARVWLGDNEVGEAGLYGALAEEHGAAVVLITGDDVLCDETRSRFLEAKHVQTKIASGFNSGRTLTPEAACDAIREAAETAVRERVQAQMRAQVPERVQEGVQKRAQSGVPMPSSSTTPPQPPQPLQPSHPSRSANVVEQRSFDCRLQTQSPALADLFCQWPSLVREDGVTLRFSVGSVADAVRIFNCLSAMSSMLR